MSDLTELFSRDPLKYSKADVAALIAAYREKRKQFNAGATMAGKAKVITPKAQALLNAVKTSDVDI